ncbi:MAG: hypothetical protein R3D78_07295 [Paracoccaceae bacterium]
MHKGSATITPICWRAICAAAGYAPIFARRAHVEPRRAAHLDDRAAQSALPRPAGPRART